MYKTLGVPVSRTNSNHFLIGQEQSDLGKDARQGKLPDTRDVLKYFFYRKKLPDFKFKPVGSAICCRFKSGTGFTNCEDNPKCRECSECVGCVVRKVKVEGNWQIAGISIISELSSLRE